MKRKKMTLAWAFGIPALLMLVIYFVNEIFPFGDRAFLTGDLYHQYLPFLQSLSDKLKAGEGLSFSLYAGIGSNYLALFVYYLANPIHFLLLLLPDSLIMEFATLIILLKISLSGMTFAAYLYEHYHKGGIPILCFSVFYALSGYAAAYNYNIMWMDAVWLFPLVLLGLERLIKKGEVLLYVISLGACIYLNYYISIMICMFVVLYGVVFFFCESRNWRRVPLFAACSLLAGGLAAVLLVPEVMAILETDFGDVSFPEEIVSYFSVFDELARHCICVECEKGLDHWPNIYAGVFAFLLVPLYLFTKEIPARTRLCMTALCGLLLFSFSTNVLDFIWHGLNYPDSLPARQSFIYIFLILVMSYGAFIHIGNRSKEMIVASVVATVAFLVLCEKMVTDDAFLPGVFVGTMMVAVLYGVLFYLYSDSTYRRWRLPMLGIFLAICVVECFVNTMATSVYTVERAAYTEKLPAYDSLYAKVESEEGFSRVELFERKTKNDGLMAGLPTATTFSSTMNSSVADFYEKMGMRHSKVYYAFDGATPFSAALLNVGYMLGEDAERQFDDAGYEAGIKDSLYEVIAEEGDVLLYRNKYSLPFGYVAPTDYELCRSYLNKPLRVQNQMVHELGIEGELFTLQACSKVGPDVYFTAPQDGYYYMTVENWGTGKVAMHTAFGEKEYTDLKEGCVLYAGYLKKGKEVVFKNNNEDDTTQDIELDAYLLDVNVLQEALDVLSENHMENVIVADNTIRGTLSLKEAGRLILSIPYEKGWKIYVNGELAAPKMFADCFITLPLDAGEYEIEMVYTPYGLWAGIAISFVSSCILVLIVWRKKKALYR